MQNTKETTEKLADAVFWKSLCPELNLTQDVGLESLSSTKIPLRPDDWEQCKELINTDAYFAYDSFYRAELIEKLADCFDLLKAEGILPIFCFVYDEFWDLLLQLRPMMSDLIGEHELLPAVWAWFVEYENQTGFAPHRDQVRETSVDDEDHLDYLTIWIPLTDLSHLSSCICVLPASLDPDYEDGVSRVCVENMQDVRTLQGKKGSVLCWTACLAHWGTKQSEFGDPRKSVGFFVQRSDAEIMVPPPMDFSKPFNLSQRLSVIGQQIIDYSREADEAMLNLAASLISK